MSWKWDDEKEKWVSNKSQKQQSLPLPSSSTAEVFLEKNHRPGWASGILKGPMFQKLEDSPTGPASPPGMNQKQMERVATSAGPKRSSKRGNTVDPEEYDWSLVDP